MTIEVSEALPKMGQKAEARDLTLRKSGQFPSHYGESFGGIAVRFTRIFTVSEFYCASQGGQGGRRPANPPPMRRRAATAISFNGESFGGIGTSII